MILNDAPLKVVAGSVRIEAFPEMTQSGQYPGPVRFGRPFKRGGKKDNRFTGTGYSDHFPISLELREKQPRGECRLRSRAVLGRTLLQ